MSALVMMSLMNGNNFCQH